MNKASRLADRERGVFACARRGGRPLAPDFGNIQLLARRPVFRDCDSNLYATVDLAARVTANRGSVDKHQGTIDFETEDERGTTFIIRLSCEGVPSSSPDLAVGCR
jgi:hypothetical protein